MKIDGLDREIRNCTRCRLFETRSQAVCGEGDLNARLMLIAQAPGENEDEEGVMFIGPSGEVLDDLLNNAGVASDDLYMTNLIKCMLPDYRKPKQAEIRTCSQYLDKEIKLIDPDILVPLGYYSTKYLSSKYEISFEEDFSKMTGDIFFCR